MYIQEFAPHSDLAEYVQVIWIMESETTADQFPREQILPDGIVELVLHFRDPFLTHRADGTCFVQPPNFAISQMRQFIEIESRGDIGFVAVRFFPWGAYHFFDTPIHSFLDSFVVSATLWERHHRSLHDQVASASDSRDRVDIVEQFLRDRLTEHRRQDNTVDAAIKRCRSERGQLKLEQLCEYAELSQKQLGRRFLAAVGTTPKTFCRVSRFLHVCHRLEDFRNRSLSELTYDCGYFDQAHFIREFKEFSGFTPKQFFKKNNVAFADF
jgi:AraC-like DNA-binding protein